MIRQKPRWIPGRVPARRMYAWERMWCAIQRGARAFWDTLRTPPVVVDEDAWTELQEHIKRVEAETASLKAESAQMEREIVARERELAARAIVDDRCGTGLGPVRVAISDRVVDDLPVTADGAVHERAVRALVDLELWSARLDDLAPATEG